MDHNGSERHRRAKKQMANLLRLNGATVTGDNDDELKIIRPDNKLPRSIDLCARLGPRIIFIEVDGFTGHKTKRAIAKDKARTAEITSLVPHSELYRFAFFQLTPWNDSTKNAVLEEMSICKLG